MYGRSVKSQVGHPLRWAETRNLRGRGQERRHPRTCGIKPAYMLFAFSRAAAAIYHKPGFKWQRLTLPQSWQAESKSKVSRGLVPSGGSEEESISVPPSQFWVAAPSPWRSLTCSYSPLISALNVTSPCTWLWLHMAFSLPVSHKDTLHWI